jgi:phytoene/squalene synthetase
MKTPETTRLDFLPDLSFDEILASPILDIGARCWETERYEAFKVCYRSMRILDNLVDNRRALGTPVSDNERLQFERMIADFIAALRLKERDDPFAAQLLDVMTRFSIPIWPWQRLAKAMTFDLHHDEFASFIVFLRYCEGAAIAPASVFVHLSGVEKDGERFIVPSFDIRLAARNLAIFSYLVHIIRDIHKDQHAGLNYFSADLLQRNKLAAVILRERVTTGDIDSSVRGLVGDVVQIAHYYRQRARAGLDQLYPTLGDRYALGLEIIYSLYLQILERIDVKVGSFTVDELQPTPEEIKTRLQAIVGQRNMRD